MSIKKGYQVKKIVHYIDPPSGWKWGFPKKLPDPMPSNINAWLLKNGYPESEMEYWKNRPPFRIYTEEENELESQDRERND